MIRKVSFQEAVDQRSRRRETGNDLPTNVGGVSFGSAEDRSLDSRLLLVEVVAERAEDKRDLPRA